MNYELHNKDLLILQAEAARSRFGQAPGWTAVDWKPTRSGGNMIYLRQFALPPTCSVARTDVKIEAPPNLYEPANGLLSLIRGQNETLIFYRNIWISPGVRITDRHGNVRHMPRLHGRDPDGFAYLCLHPDPVAPGRNVLDLLKTFDLFLLNPGYKAGAGESI